MSVLEWVLSEPSLGGGRAQPRRPRPYLKESGRQQLDIMFCYVNPEPVHAPGAFSGVG